MFDNGLRLVRVSYSQYESKLGLVDVKGNFVVPPIYDSIAPRYNVYDGNVVRQNDDLALDLVYPEVIFKDGYTQVTRNGKMGLLDTKGKEVIPCKYDAVGLPVEGMCRVILNGKLGYWNLISKKELVAPKYILEVENDKTAAGNARSLTPITNAQALVNPSTINSANGKNTRLPAWFDFNGGYALVPMSTSDKLGLVKAQIIDKNGKQILSGGPYTYRTYHHRGESYSQFNVQYSYTQYTHDPDFENYKSGGSYPQFGPYMDYQKVIDVPMVMHVDHGGIFKDITEKIASGIVGPKGVMIKPQYHGNIQPISPGIWAPSTANLKIYTDLSLYTANCSPDIEQERSTSSYLYGTFDLKTSKKIIPARGTYDPAHHVLWGNADFANNNAAPKDGFIFFANKKLVKYPNTRLNGLDLNTGSDKGYLAMSNGTTMTGLISVTTGKTYTFSSLKSVRYVGISDAGTVLTEKNGKIGVVRLSDGKVLNPYQYEIEDLNERVLSVQENWSLKNNAYTIVSKNGKWGLIDVYGNEILECKYESIYKGLKYAIVQDSNGIGYFDVGTKKFVVPIQIGVPESDNQFAALGAAKIGNGKMITKDGSILDLKLGADVLSPKGLFITDTEINAQLSIGYEELAVGAEGKVVMPIPGDQRIVSDYTVVVEGGKIGYINTIFLDWAGKSQSAVIQEKLANIQADKESASTKVKIVSYNVVKQPTKLTYKYGDTYQIDGLEVESVDTNGTRVKITNDRIMIYFIDGDDVTKMWSSQWGGTGLNYTIPLKEGTNVLKIYVDERDSGATINMELKK